MVCFGLGYPHIETVLLEVTLIFLMASRDDNGEAMTHVKVTMLSVTSQKKCKLTKKKAFS